MKKKKLSSKFSKMLLKHIDDLNENSMEIDTIVNALLKSKINSNHRKYLKDIQLLQGSIDEIDDLLKELGN